MKKKKEKKRKENQSCNIVIKLYIMGLFESVYFAEIENFLLKVL